MNGSFYSFVDAFKEASRRQGEKYFVSDNEKMTLDYVRRQFRRFLDALSIEYSSLKDPEQISNFRDAEDSKEGGIIAQYIAHCKNVAYSFNDDGFNFAVDFICNWKNPEYKMMRRREFFVEGKAKYQKIISAIKSNMAALGYTSETIFQQECMFWRNIAHHSSYDILDFLDISALLGRDGKLREMSKLLSPFEVDDFIYANNLVCQDYIKFQEKWLIRIEKALQYRRDFASKSLNDPDMDDFLGLLAANLCSSSYGDGSFSSLDLKSQKQMDDVEKEFLCNNMSLILTVANCDNIPKLQEPIKSKELFDQIIEKELRANQENLKADDKLPCV